MWTLKDMMMYELEMTAEEAEEILKELFEEIED